MTRVYRLGAALSAVACASVAAPVRAQDADANEQLELLKEDIEVLRRQMDETMPAANRFRGYLDVGFFATSGDGSGVRSDVLHVYFPEFADTVAGPWVFMGDPMSTAVNARGEPADTGPSRAIRLDSVDSGGTPSFLVNTLSVGLLTAAGPHDDLTVTAQMDFIPRERSAADGDPSSGRYVDLKLAFAEYWLPTRTPISVYAGKFYSVLGIEYRTQEADRRLGVTPSLTCRYTCGYPTGLGVRAELLDRALYVNAAVTNGSHFVSAFSFSDDIDDNAWKTLAGRAAWTFDVRARLEIGLSGAIGPQDEQPRNDVIQWQYGLDLNFDFNDLLFAAEFVQGNAEGRDAADAALAPCALAPCIEYKSAYGWVGWRATNWVTPYLRVDWRDALHQNGASFVYVSELIRATGGLHFEMGTYLLLKAEYTWNRELGRIPQFPNDVFASSLVVKY